MYLPVDETLQLGLDCVATLSPTHAVVHGWAMTPRGAKTGLSILAGTGTGADQDCVVEHCSFQPRPDVVPKDPRRAVVSGFFLLVATPAGARDLRLVLRAGGEVVRVDLRDPAIETDLPKVLATRDWRATFGLLRGALDDPGLGPLLDSGARPLGAFAEWLSRLAVLRGRHEEFAQMTAAEALSTPAGEILTLLRPAVPMGPEAGLEAVLVGWLRDEEDGSARAMLLPMADRHEARLPGVLAFYARAEAGWLDRLVSLELLAEIRLKGEERVWLRIQPAGGGVPAMLDAAARGTPGASLATGRGATAALGLLRDLLARREAAFAPAIAALASTGSTAGTTGPARSLLVVGADDPAAARLFQVTAREVERRCDRLLVLGDAAEAVGRVFAERNRVEVAVGAEAMAALREAAGRGAIIALDAVRYAEAVAAGRGDAAFPAPIDAVGVARLLTLHAVAGTGPALADSLRQLLATGQPGQGGAAARPPRRGAASREAEQLVNDHLARLWRAGSVPSPRPAESMTHA